MEHCQSFIQFGLGCQWFEDCRQWFFYRYVLNGPGRLTSGSKLFAKFINRQQKQGNTQCGRVIDLSLRLSREATCPEGQAPR